MLDDIHTDVAIIGAGTAGLYALREVRRAGRRFVLIDPGPLGTTCARVGCMPSKIALHAAALWQARPELSRFGVTDNELLPLDLARTWAALRAQRDHFSNKASQKTRTAAGEQLIEGSARFIEPTLLEVTTPQGVQRIRADAVVIANGSRPLLPDWLTPLRARLVTTDALFEL
ncbi:MAG: FAD-dependent oxidoreductase, partial [Halopseudomonas sp.]